MGAEGGIVITKISDIKQNWKEIKNHIIQDLKEDLDLSYYHSKEEDLEKTKALPNDISELSPNEIVGILNHLSSYQCPYLYEGIHLITAWGKNVSEGTNALSYSLKKFGVEIQTCS